jgi:hypothetical protein
VVRVLGPGRDVDDVAGADGHALAGDAQRAFALQHDEHLFLGMVEVVGAAHLPGRDGVDTGAELPGGRAF